MIETTHSEIPAAPVDTGLRSAPGIRWLLLAGALVTGVSVYRLLEAQWTAIPVPLQFLVLVAGALGIFGLGRITRRRLNLPHAGSALLFLFTGLLPVLAWGASWLRLLDTVWGWLAFSAGGAVLLGAAVSVLRSELRYPGRLYPAILGILFLAQAALPSLGERWMGEGLYVLSAFVLGLVLHVGSRHVNRFFFHRDQRDGRDRPVHFVPFLLLGLLYVGALTGLDLDSPFLGLPVAVLGIVLACTGEEYYRALTASLGRAPQRWPWRSAALLALGFSLSIAALSLALRDPSGHCLFLTSLCTAGLSLRWSLRYGDPSVHVLGVLAALTAWNSAPFLAPLRNDGAILLGWNELGFFAVLAVLGFLLRHRQAPERLHRIHGALMALLLLAIAAFALSDFYYGTTLLAAAGAVGLMAGYGLRHSPTFLAGGLMLSAGAHGELLFHRGGATAWTALLTQSFFVLSWLGARRLREFRGGLKLLAVLHGVLGLVWMAAAATASTVSVEPLILLLAGLALLWEGLADQRREGTHHEGIDLGLALAVLWLPVQILLPLPCSWSWLLVVGLTLAGLELGLLVFAARRSPGHWLARRFGMDLEDWDVLTALSLRGLVRVWLVLAAAAGLLFAGREALALTLAMTGVLFLTRTGIEGWAPRLAFPARLTLLPLLQLAVLAAEQGHPERDLVPAILSALPTLIPWMAACGLAWRGLIEILGRRRSLRSWTLGVETATALGYLLAFFNGPALSPWTDVILIALAAVWAALSFFDAKRDRDALYGWQMQAWAGLTVLHGFTAGWLHLGSGVAPYVLLAAGAAQYALGAFYERRDLGASITPSCRFMGLGLPLLAGSLSLTVFPGTGALFPVLATFLVSLFYTVVASRETRRVFPAAASVAFLGLALLKTIATAGLGTELYCLAPGFGLLLLAWLLRAELGPLWNRRVTAAGASFIYATPIVALSSEISWGWLAVLLVLSVAFGAASFALRSRALLTVSTAALLTDLGFFVFRIGTTAPLVLWVLGLGFGMTLMATAAWLEYRREGVLQQIRVFGRELHSWS